MFKKGVTYERDELAKTARPDNRPDGGDWTTAHARIETDLLFFMDIVVPGRTSHNFNNHFDKNTGNLV